MHKTIDEMLFSSKRQETRSAKASNDKSFENSSILVENQGLLSKSKLH